MSSLMISRKLTCRILCIVFLFQLAPVFAENAIKLERVFETVSFQRPLAFLPAPDKPNVWYVVEQAGRIIRLQSDNGKLKHSVFIDIRHRVESGPNEAGLLGMAFDPKFSENGRFYLSYTRDDDSLESVLSRFISRDMGLSGEAGKEQILLKTEQPYSNHNGGDIHFGPDGYLYLGLGDGGSAGDPDENGQNTQTLLGTLMRLDVSGKQGYQIPNDNPFVNGGGKAEIFAYGLRNPWRWSFDRKTGELWLADVGQNAWEEVNRIERGGNYGWDLREGKHCYSGDCDRAGLIDPVTEYSHDEGCSITGGYVYRGDAIPSLQGTYLYGDYCSGTIWGFNTDSRKSANGKVMLRTGLNISSFGEDNDGEIYVIDLGGKIYRIVQN